MTLEKHIRVLEQSVVSMEGKKGMEYQKERFIELIGFLLELMERRLKEGGDAG